MTGPDHTPSRPRVLSIAGTDPTGGAGIQADLKAFAAHGAYGMAVVTALVAQNTHGVRSTHLPGPSFLREQLEAVSDDVTVDAVKIGMVATEANGREIDAWLGRQCIEHVVLDPVMVATSGDRLLDEDAERSVRGLLDLVGLVTPNLPELAVLLDEPVAEDWAGALAQAGRLARRHELTVLVKGGHLDRWGRSPDAVVDREGVVELDAERIRTTATHGTGCSLSAAIAALRPRRDDWARAAREAKDWLHGAIAAGEALRVGSGHGPVDHLHLSSPATDFTGQAWSAIDGVRAEVEDMPFIRQLGSGALDARDFAYYLAQDALYLREYSRVLSRVSSLAPDRRAQEFFAASAVQCLVGESALHREWLSGHGEEVPDVARPSAVTAAYTDHLHRAAAVGSYAEAVAAVLPCYWLYAHIGTLLLDGLQRSGLDVAGHPYGRWIGTYADEGFQASVATACALADEAARTVDAGTRDRMLEAFVMSSRHEWAFFDQGTRERAPLPG